MVTDFMVDTSVRRVGRVSSFGKKLDKNNYHFGFAVTELGEEFFLHERNLDPALKDLDRNDIITFKVLHKPIPSGKCDVAVEVKRLKEETDESILEYCFQHPDRKFWLLVAKKYVLPKPVESAIQLVFEKMRSLNSTNKKLLVEELLEIFKFPQANILREICDAKTRLDIIRCILADQSTGEYLSLQTEIQAMLMNVDQEAQNNFWNDVSVQQRLTYKGFLWDLAPTKFREKILREEYAKFFKMLDEFYRTFSEYPGKEIVSTEASRLYTNLQPEDYALAEQWGKAEKSGNREYVRATMISARAAEKCVQNFYTSLGYTVTDTAIQQVNSSGDDWRKFDLLLDMEIPIDVKNARSALNASQRYSEFFVPCYKQARGCEVRIAGVFSPYLKLRHCKRTTSCFWGRLGR